MISSATIASETKLCAWLQNCTWGIMKIILSASQLALLALQIISVVFGSFHGLCYLKC